MRTEKIEVIGFIDISTSKPQFAEVGKDGCLSITEKPAYGEGDKWFYDIAFDSGKTLRIFNPDSLIYETNNP